MFFPRSFAVCLFLSFLSLILAASAVAQDGGTLARQKPAFAGKRISAPHFITDQCDVAKPFGYGQTFGGSLDPSDCMLDDGTYADIYALEGASGQQIQIDLVSQQVDAYLIIVDEAGDFVVQDDDGGGGTNARINTTLPHDGKFLILANSYSPEFGGYQITLDKTPRCSFTPSPAAIDVPSGGGTFTFDVQTEPGCHWTASSPQRPHIVVQPNWYEAETVGFNGPRSITYFIDYNDTGGEFQGSIVVGGTAYTIRQAALVCTYTLDKYNMSFPGADSTQQLTLTTAPGCEWRGQNSISYFGLDQWSGRGPAVLTVRAYTNNGATRTGWITIADKTVNIEQTGLNCTYTVTPTTFDIEADAAPGIIQIDTQQNCTWSLESDGFVQYNSQSGPGAKDVTFYFNRNYMATPRTHTVRFFGGGLVTIPLTFNQAGADSSVVRVSGIVRSPDGRGLRGVAVDLVDEAGNIRTVTTSSLGYFTFDNVQSGYGYFFRARSKRYRFSQIYWAVITDVSDIVLTGFE